MKKTKRAYPKTPGQAAAWVDTCFDAIEGGPSAKDALEENWLDVMAIRRVAQALARDSSDVPEALVNECKTTDLKHVAELLTQVHNFDMLAPGALAWLLDGFLPYLFARYRAQRENEILAPFAKHMGYGPEFEAFDQARQRGFKGEMYSALATLLTKMSKRPEEAVIEEIAQRHNLDLESLKRSIRRARKRSK